MCCILCAALCNNPALQVSWHQNEVNSDDTTSRKSHLTGQIPSAQQRYNPDFFAKRKKKKKKAHLKKKFEKPLGNILHDTYKVLKDFPASRQLNISLLNQKETSV